MNRAEVASGWRKGWLTRKRSKRRTGRFATFGYWWIFLSYPSSKETFRSNKL
ncbi:MAG: hypothetical protein MUO29_00670 [Desulfobacterales bacterium]|nr:hypothetical protein [Desulfobacterales bacterium]